MIKKKIEAAVLKAMETAGEGQASDAAKDYNEKYLLSQEQSEAQRSGDIHIHDFAFYALMTTCY